MARDTTSGSFEAPSLRSGFRLRARTPAIRLNFDFTSRLRRSVPLRTTGLGGMARAVCCCVMLAVPGLARALQSPQETPPAVAQPSKTPPATTPPIQASPTTQPAPLPALPPTNADNAARAPGPYDEIVVTA